LFDLLLAPARRVLFFVVLVLVPSRTARLVLLVAVFVVPPAPAWALVPVLLFLAVTAAAWALVPVLFFFTVTAPAWALEVSTLFVGTFAGSNGPRWFYRDRLSALALIGACRHQDALATFLAFYLLTRGVFGQAIPGPAAGASNGLRHGGDPRSAATHKADTKWQRILLL
jgi:hypothetical protein